MENSSYFQGRKHEGEDPVVWLVEGPFPGERWSKPFAFGKWSEATASTRERCIEILTNGSLEK